MFSFNLRVYELDKQTARIIIILEAFTAFYERVMQLMFTIHVMKKVNISNALYTRLKAPIVSSP